MDNKLPKKRIVLCGATSGSNFGDMLFALMFVEYLNKTFENVEVAFVSASSFAKDKVSLPTRRLSWIWGADAFVYISGGYFGETPRESFVQAVRRFFRYYAFGLLMRALGRPIGIIGVGSGVLNRWFLRWPVVTICNGADAIAVRETQSRDYLQKYGVTRPIQVTSDSAQSIKEDFFASIYEDDSSPSASEGSEKTVLIHFTRMSFKYDYPRLIVASLKKSLVLDPAYRFVLCHDGDWIDEELRDIQSQLPADRATIHQYDGPVDLLNAINRADVVITPKLHVGIIGCTFGKILLSFPYHPKVQRYYEQIGFGDHCLPLVGITEDAMVEKIMEKHRDPVVLPPSILADAWKNFEILGKFCDSIGANRAKSTQI